MLTVKGRVGIRAGRQDVGLAGDLDDVRGMPAAGPLGVEAVDRPALDRRDRVVEEPALVERVGVDGDLNVVLVGHRQAGVDHGERGAPVLVQLQSARAGLDLVLERFGQAAVSLAQDADVDRQPLERLKHPHDVPWARACRSWPRCPLPSRCRRRSAW